jgi:hypothetical protein
LLAIHVDPAFLTGSLHHKGGIVFFALGMFILLAVLWWLQKSETLRLCPGKLPAGAAALSRGPQPVSAQRSNR